MKDLPAISVINAIVHKINKDAHKSAQPQYRNSCFKFDNNNENDVTLSFVKAYVGVFIKTRSGKSYGVFEKDNTQFKFQDMLKTYLKDQDLVRFSKSTVGILANNMNNASASKGGYVFFLYYRLEDKKRFAVIMLDQKGETGINDETLELNSSMILDIADVTMAADISIEDWQNDSISYISFKKGAKRNEVPHYFYNAIGCTDAPNSAAATGDLVRGLIKFYEHKNLSNDQINSKKSEIYFALRGKKGIVVKDILVQLFPDENEREEIESYWIKKGIDVPDIFDCDARGLVSLTHLQVKEEGFEMKIRGDSISKYLFFPNDSEYPILKIENLKKNIEIFSSGNEDDNLSK